MSRGGFKGHKHCAAPFAAQADALGQPADNKKNGRPDANGVVGRDAANKDCGHAHDFQRQHQHFFAADFVAEVSKNDAAQRPGHKAYGKSGKS